MTGLAPSAATALLCALTAPDWPRLLDGNRHLLTSVLRFEPPDSLVDHVLATGDPRLLTDLAHSADAARRRPDLAGHLAAVLEPGAVWDALRGTSEWEYRHWETILRRTPPDDPRLRTADAGELRSNSRSVLVHSPMPEHCRYMLRHERRYLTPREQVHALAGVHRAEGAEAVHSAIEEFRPEEGPRFVAAMDDPDRLAALLAELDGTAAAIEALRREDDGYQAYYDARERAGLDWALIAAEHAAEPFTDEVVTELATRGDCPEKLLRAFFAELPVEIADACRHPPVALFGDDLSDEARGELFACFSDRGRVEELVEHGRPAAAVLRSVSRPDERITREITPVHTLVRRILAETVGLNPATWRGLRGLLATHPGTVRELCEAAPGPGGGADDSEAGDAYRVLLDAAVPRPEPDPSGPPQLVALDAGATLAQVVKRRPARGRDAVRDWMQTGVTSGRLTVADLLRDGRPAAITLSVAQWAHPVDRLPPLRELAGDLTSEAVLLALEMVGDFDGTVPELLATARTVTREEP